MSIKENLEIINSKIADAASGSGKNPEDITLVGVSKRISNELIIEGIRSGLINLGENYAQEFRDKYEILNKDHDKVIWHFIGHLQKNKIKYVIGKIALFHSLNSAALAEEINKRAEKLGINANMLIEINTSEEESKTGITIEESDKLLKKARQLKKYNNKRIYDYGTLFC